VIDKTRGGLRQSSGLVAAAGWSRRRSALEPTAAKVQRGPRDAGPRFGRRVFPRGPGAGRPGGFPGRPAFAGRPAGWCPPVRGGRRGPSAEL